MIETLDRKERKANKEHHCDFCSGIIEKGEVYDWSKNICDGELYEWKSHKKCSFLCSKLWHFIEPDDGMDEISFRLGLHDFCELFICPDCSNYDKEYYVCKEENEFCLEKAYQYLQTHELYKDRGMWKCKERLTEV